MAPTQKYCGNLYTDVQNYFEHDWDHSRYYNLVDDSQNIPLVYLLTDLLCGIANTEYFHVRQSIENPKLGNAQILHFPMLFFRGKANNP